MRTHRYFIIWVLFVFGALNVFAKVDVDRSVIDLHQAHTFEKTPYRRTAVGGYGSHLYPRAFHGRTWHLYSDTAGSGLFRSCGTVGWQWLENNGILRGCFPDQRHSVLGVSRGQGSRLSDRKGPIDFRSSSYTAPRGKNFTYRINNLILTWRNCLERVVVRVTFIVLKTIYAIP